MKLWFLLSFLLGTLFVNGQSKDAIKIADSLALNKLYSEASVWYHYALYNSNAEDLNENAITGKLNCLKALGLFNEAKDFLLICNNINTSNDFKTELQFQEMLISYLSGNFLDAIDLSAGFNDNIKKETKVMTSMIVILSYNELYKWKEADSALQLLIQQYPSKDSTVSRMYAGLPRLKNEKKARILSALFPGLGQMYAGKFWPGIANAVLQFGCLGFSIATWQREYYYSSVLIGVNNFISFRQGDKLRTQTLIKQLNRKKCIEFNENIKLQLSKYVQNTLQ